jgi:hypothetical protein
MGLFVGKMRKVTERGRGKERKKEAEGKRD